MGNDKNQLSETFGIVAAVLAFVFICIVIVRNRVTGDWVNKVFTANSYYELEKRDAGNLNEVSVYNNIMNKENDDTCPQVNITGSTYGQVLLTAQGDKYKHVSWIANCYDCTGSTSTLAVVTTTTESGAEDKVRQAIGLKDVENVWDTVGDVDGVPVYASYDSSSDGSAEIIAPVHFKFANMNTDADKSICIYDSSGNMRFTWTGVTNWYCAGSPNSYTGWAVHGTNGKSSDNMRHLTIIGNSANAVVQGGSAGDVIGYANTDTKLKIEVLLNGSWTQISIKDWIMSTKR